jgi:hypothetical protein
MKERILKNGGGGGARKGRITAGGLFLDCLCFFVVLYSSLLHLLPSNSTLSEHAGLESRTFSILSLAVDALTARLDHPQREGC